MFANLVRSGRPDHKIGQFFSPDRTRPESDFWTVAHNPAGHVVAAQAFRLVNLATNLADFLGSSLRVFAPSDLEVDFSKSRYMAGSGAKRILGKACFCDEFWINEKLDPFLAAGTPVLLAKIGLPETAIRLNPDFVFGLTMRSGPLRFRPSFGKHAC